MATTPKKRRSRGAGGLIKIQSGNYAYQFTDANGKRCTKSLRTKDRKEAETKAKKYQKAVDAEDREEVLLQAAKARRIIDTKELALGKVWKAFMDTKPTTRQSTLGNYERNLRHFAEWLGVSRPSIESLGDVDTDTCRHYLQDLWGTGISAATFNQRRMSLQRIHKAVGKKHGFTNPWALTDSRKVNAQTRLPLNAEQAREVGRVFDNAKIQIPYREEMRVMFILGLYAGMREGDAAKLEWSSVDIEAGRLSYVPSKTGSRRAEVPILPPLADALRAMAGKGEKHVLPQIAEHFKRNAHYIRKETLKVLHRVTGKGKDHNKAVSGQRLVTRSAYGFHSLRHTFSTECAHAGVSVAYLSLMAGDAIKTLEKYYLHIGLATELVSGFETMPKMIEAKATTDPERAQLHRLAEELSIEAVRVLLKTADSLARDSVPWRDVCGDIRDNVPGTVLSGARAKAGLSQVELAGQAEIPQRHISEMENGKRTIGKDRARRLADVLNIPYQSLL